jgi:hypothetical protein
MKYPPADPYEPPPPPTYMDLMAAVETLMRAGYAEEAGMVLWDLRSDAEKDAILKAMMGQAHG